MDNKKKQSSESDEDYELSFKYLKQELSDMWNGLVHEIKEEITGAPDRDTFIDLWKALGHEIAAEFSDCRKLVKEIIRPKMPTP